MADEADGVDEAVQAAVQAGLITATRLAEQIARAREDASRRAQAHSEQAAREDAQRLTAERFAARGYLAATERPDWWDRATPEDIARAYQTSAAWAETDPEMARTQDRLRQEVAQRYGVNMDAAGADPHTVAETLSAAGQARRVAESQRGGARGDQLDAAQLVHEAGEADRHGDRATKDRHDAQEAGDHPLADPAGAEVDHADSVAAEGMDRAETAYDSAERRADLADTLEGVGNDKAVDARVRADTSQAKPATEATRGGAGKAPKARRTRATAPRQRERTSRGR